LGVALFFPAYLSYFAALVADKIANEMQGRRAAVTGLAFLIAPIIATYLAEKLGFRGAFFTMGILVTFTVIIPLFFMSPASRPSPARWRGHDLVRTCRQAGIFLRRPGFLMVVVVNAIAAMLFGQVGGPFLALYIRGLGFSETAVGGFIGLRSAGDTVLRLAFGRVSKRILPAYLLAFSVISGGFLFLWVPAISAPLLLGGLLLVIGIVHAPRNPAVIGIASEQFSDEERDLGMALLFTVGNVVIALASPALGALGDAAGLYLIFLVGGCLAIGVTLTLTIVGRRVALRENAPRTMVELWYGT
jgi:MFS family permease